MFIAVAVAIGLNGCKASVGAEASIPSDAPMTCRVQCSELGMELGAMATMANSVGCVCQPKRADMNSERASVALLGGMAAPSSYVAPMTVTS